MAHSTEIMIEEYKKTGIITDLPIGHFIDGQIVPGHSGQKMASFDPGNAEVFAEFASGDESDIEAAVTSAEAAFPVWRDTAPADRGRILLEASRLILANLDRFAIVECIDSGKPLTEARGDVAGAARCFEYYAGACDKLEGNTFPLASNYLGYSTYEPIGVTAHIIPWNYPISTTARGIAPALAAGCTAVVKPAEQTPFTALLLAEILTAAGLPSGVCNVVTGTGKKAGAPLVAHRRIDHITFTGSVATGTDVMKSAAENITRLVLELGGKSPIIVLDDCNIDQAVDGVMGAIFENAGQICSAGSRLIVEKSIHDILLERLSARAAELTLGHGLFDPGMGPVNSEQQLNRISGFVDRARERGAEMIVGGNKSVDEQTGKGWFFEPTIVADRPLDDELVQEEIFGPVLTVQVADDREHAVTLANGTKYGLVAGIYTSDFSTAHAMARSINAGQIYLNEYFAGGIEVPFGGEKFSGFGREKGMDGLKSYCTVKSIAARI
ncbi:MAG: aldehyde dehydrogenase family protein [Pseudomonadota bacterium]